ncbi:MAG: hypothetical protein DRP78_00175 [Candidatus Omnitrophota bacterium]|nr:MAG: hypothetical protein DRP78_00175 [Candidatus Omnitrophota bacterium]
MGLGQINTNLSALKAYNQLTQVNRKLGIHQERISTGKTVNRAADNPAGYYITQIYQRDISVLNRNLAHVDNARAELQAQDSKMAQVVSMLQDVEDLVLQAKSELVTTAQKSAIKAEIDQLVAEIGSVVDGLKDLSGGTSAGIDVGASLNVYVAGTATSTTDLSLVSTTGAVIIKVASTTEVSSSLTILSSAITTMLNREEKVGAYISRLESKADAYAVDVVNKKAQKSVIEDADLAFEQMEVTKTQILQQSALAMLAQTNMAPQSLLQLIMG